MIKLSLRDNMLARATHSHMGRDVLTSVAVHYGRLSKFNKNEQCDFWFFVFCACFKFITIILKYVQKENLLII